MDRVRLKDCSETEPKRCWTVEVQNLDLNYTVTLNPPYAHNFRCSGI